MADLDSRCEKCERDIEQLRGAVAEVIDLVKEYSRKSIKLLAKSKWECSHKSMKFLAKSKSVISGCSLLCRRRRMQASRDCKRVLTRCPGASARLMSHRN
jgi:hypothetical protein